MLQRDYSFNIIPVRLQDKQRATTSKEMAKQARDNSSSVYTPDRKAHMTKKGSTYFKKALLNSNYPIIQRNPTAALKNFG